ncbi:MAG: YbaN family protein [Clostridiales bacterium]|jgi:uncharacterized membrane protein YbaN (DUF454 family)|nr:YbaN family protein [Clostridiales bacterium]
MKQTYTFKKKKHPVKGPGKYLFIVAGVLSLAVGVIGVILPFLPSTPFFLLTVICFAKGSQKLHDWFLSTKLYQKHLESFVQKRAMTLKTKLSILCSVTVLMGFGFIMMSRVPVGRVILGAVWLGHVLYFIFRIKTVRPDTEKTD